MAGAWCVEQADEKSAGREGNLLAVQPKRQITGSQRGAPTGHPLRCDEQISPRAPRGRRRSLVAKCTTARRTARCVDSGALSDLQRDLQRASHKEAALGPHPRQSTDTQHGTVSQSHALQSVAYGWTALHARTDSPHTPTREGRPGPEKNPRPTLHAHAHTGSEFRICTHHAALHLLALVIGIASLSHSTQQSSRHAEGTFSCLAR